MALYLCSVVMQHGFRNSTIQQSIVTLVGHDVRRVLVQIDGMTGPISLRFGLLVLLPTPVCLSSIVLILGLKVPQALIR